MNYLTSELVFYVFAVLALITAVLVVVKANPVGSAVCLALCFVAAAAIMFQLDAPFLGVIQILVYTGAIMVLVLFVVMLLNLKEEKKAFARPLPVIGGIVIAAAFMAQLWGVVYSIPGAEESRGCCAGRQSCPFNDLKIGENNVHTEQSVSAKGGIRISTTNISGKLLDQLAIGTDFLFSDAIPAIGQSPVPILPEIVPSRFNYPAGSSVARNVAEGQFPDTAFLGYRLFSKYNKELIFSSLALLTAAIGSVVLTRKPDNTSQN